jgi:hypothetical protein
MVTRNAVKRLDVLLLEARGDVASKPMAQIHQESAWRWAALSVAACEAGLLGDIVDYAHEAIEHAALADPTGKELLAVRAWIHARIPPNML